MKTTLLSLAAFLLSFHLSAQYLKGIVRQKSGASVPNAQVIIKDVTFSKTLGDGGFELKLPADHVAGMRIVLDVQKEGMELVDEREIVTYVRRDPNDLVVVRMAPQGEKQRETARIKENLRQSIERNYKKKFEEQQQQFRSQQDRLADENSRLGRERDQALQLVEELAKEMYRADLSGVDSTYRLAYNLFIDGKVEEAQAVVKKANLRKQLSDIQEEKRQAAIRAEEIIKAEKQIAQTAALDAKMSISLLKFKEAEEAYDLAVEADTTNFDIVFEFALFLQNQKQFSKVESHYRRALALAKDAESKATILNNLGVFYSANQRMSEAEKAYEEALSIFRQLATKNLDAFLPVVAGTLNNLGIFYYTNQKMPEAEKAYKEALGIRRELAEKNPDAFLRSLASTLNNLGNYYSDKQNLPEAEKAYDEALSIRRKLAGKDDACLLDLATTLNNLGVFYSDIYNFKKKWLKSEKASNNTLILGWKLNIPELHLSLGGSSHRDTIPQKMLEAEKAYKEALGIRRELAEKNPDAFLPDVAMTLKNLGNYYCNDYVEMMPEAEKAYNEALSIRRVLAEKNPDAFLSDVAMMLDNLGEYYLTNDKGLEAEKAYNEALSIYRKLAEQNPDVFLPYVAGTLYSLGVLKKQYTQALDCYEEALLIRQTALLAGQSHFFEDWERVMISISYVRKSTEGQKQFTLTARAEYLLATSCDSLLHLHPPIPKKQAVLEYGNLSWWALFARDYPLAEHAALRCFALDPEQIYVYTNLGHSHLLRGDVKKAKEAYLHLKGKKDGGGKDYKLVLEEDFQALEAEGITHKGMAEIRKWLREEW